MKLSELPREPSPQSFGRRVYAVAWFPFWLASGLLVELAGSARIGFLLGAGVTSVLALSAVFSGQLTQPETVQLLALALFGGGAAFTLLVFVISSLAKLLHV